MTGRIRIAGVCERDLDLLLMEELVASPEFRSWFARIAGLGELDHRMPSEVFRSVTHSSGESDLELYVTLGDGRRAGILIENKIDAGLQRRQSQRYRDRAAARIAEKRCSIGRTVIVAPMQYFGASEDVLGFDATTTYEAIDEWFTRSDTMGERTTYKRSLLAAAIEKSTLGYQRVADQAMTELWNYIWTIATAEAPQLNMSEPIGRPAKSSFVFFKPDQFPHSFGLVYKFRHGNVDFVLPGWGNRLSELRKNIGPLLPKKTKLEATSKAAVIRARVAPLEVAESPESQRSAVVEGLHMAVELLEWYRTNQPILDSLG